LLKSVTRLDTLKMDHAATTTSINNAYLGEREKLDRRRATFRLPDDRKARKPSVRITIMTTQPSSALRQANVDTKRDAAPTQLLSPFRLGGFELRNRLVMSPMTRSRALDGNVPNPLSATYYVQRAAAGLAITEATQVSPQGVGYIRTPGIHSVEQWRAGAR
jgi:hypothetical protein